MIFLDLDDLFHIAERALGVPAQVGDVGLLLSALARPQATAIGTEAYPSIQAKAAALLHSLVRNHGLVDGNKRLALASVVAFYGMNGLRLTMTNDEAFELVTAVADASLDDVSSIASRLESGTRRMKASRPRHA